MESLYKISSFFPQKLKGLITALLLLPGYLYAQVEFTSSNLPIVLIDTDGQEIEDEDRIVADMGIIYNGEGKNNHISDPHNNYEGKIAIELRGSTSQDFPKKSYSFETQDNSGENRNVSLLGMPEENDWVLYAPYTDKTLVRNILSYQLSSQLGHYAPRTRLCEVELNGQYQGVYVLIEKIKRDRNRVNISKLGPEDLTGDDLSGGYILKIDKQTGNSGPLWTSSSGGIYFQYEYPEYDEIVQEQKDYIKGYIDEFEFALNSDHFDDPELGFRKYFDVNSLVDFFIVNEMARNVDAYMLSTFLYKRKESEGGKLNMGPVWDFNLSFGNCDYRNSYLNEGLQLEENNAPWWWERFMEDTSFVTDIHNRWIDIRGKQFGNEAILASIDSLGLKLEEAQQRNFQKWDVLGRKIWPNYFVGETFDDEIDYLKSWTLSRLSWLDNSLSVTTPIEEIPTNIYPNPFRTKFQYEFVLNRSGKINLALYDLSGRKAGTLINNIYYTAGEHSIQWESPDLGSSVYLLILSIDDQMISRKKIMKL